MKSEDIYFLAGAAVDYHHLVSETVPLIPYYDGDGDFGFVVLCRVVLASCAALIYRVVCVGCCSQYYQ